MKNQSHFSQIPQTEVPLDPFPQPRTIPDGWDLTDMLAAADSSSTGDAGAVFSFATKPKTPVESGNDPWISA